MQYIGNILPHNLKRMAAQTNVMFLSYLQRKDFYTFQQVTMKTISWSFQEDKVWNWDCSWAAKSNFYGN